MGGVAVGVGRLAKLPHASVGAPQIKAAAKSRRSLTRRFAWSLPEVVESSMFIT
jgi:hypothetical protein